MEANFIYFLKKSIASPVKIILIFLNHKYISSMPKADNVFFNIYKLCYHAHVFQNVCKVVFFM